MIHIYPLQQTNLFPMSFRQGNGNECWQPVTFPFDGYACGYKASRPQNKNLAISKPTFLSRTSPGSAFCTVSGLDKLFFSLMPQQGTTPAPPAGASSQTIQGTDCSGLAFSFSNRDKLTTHFYPPYITSPFFCQ